MRIQRVAVLGAGAMGQDIALSWALSGLDVRLWARRPESLEQSRAHVDRNLSTMISAGLVGADEAQAAKERIAYEAELGHACREADLVIEAVVEDLALKQALLRQAEEYLPAGAITSSTTSSLSTTAIAAGLKDGTRFINIHYAQPAHLMPLAEVVPGQATRADVLEATCEGLRRTGHIPAVIRDVPGFVWTRIQMAILREAVSLVRQGVTTPETVDQIMKFGYAMRLPAMGPFEHADLGGLDLIQAVCKVTWPALDDSRDPGEGPVGDLVRKGDLGMRSGMGFYDWRERSPQAFKDARDAEVIRRLKLLGWHPHGWQP